MTLPVDWRERPTLSIPETGEVLGLSRQGAYDAARRGDFKVIRIGRRLVVPVVALRRLLGELDRPLTGLAA